MEILKKSSISIRTWKAALAVPEMLCVKGVVAFICMTVTNPIANPMQPVILIEAQKNTEYNLAELSIIIFER